MSPKDTPSKVKKKNSTYLSLVRGKNYQKEIYSKVTRKTHKRKSIPSF